MDAAYVAGPNSSDFANFNFVQVMRDHVPALSLRPASKPL